MTHTKPLFLLGAHISIAGGFDKSVERAQSINCTCMQIFTKSNQQWRSKPIDPHEALQFKEAVKKSKLQSVVVHASYLINIGSPETALQQKSTAALAEELQRCHTLDIPYLVLHPGSASDGDEQACITRIAQNLDAVFNDNPGSTMILLENTAGQGNAVGYTFEQLAEIRKQAHHKKNIGFCFDTCHAFTAGYDFRTEETYEKLWHTFDRVIGLEHLKAIHINDSKKELGSRVDRHETIGSGKLTDSAFKLLFNDPRFFAIPKILETPKEDLSDDVKNMEIIMGLLSAQTKRELTVL